MANVSQDYQIVEKVMTDGDIPITLYVNKVTGLHVTIAHVECPIVKGDMSVATEAHDDDGLPHTLEHLIFLGSEDYPYKGVLDTLASKCLSAGTNAYTDTDYTNYTVSTAGSDGFLTLLPIYLDHLLYPLITEEGYKTEVHHINGEGEDAGVVYCEMQARENTGSSRCYLEMLRALYPGKCGYKSETGGILHNLRTSTSVEKVRKYHRNFYNAKNLCLIVTGPVEAEDVFKAIKPIEDKIIVKGDHLIKIDRPWQSVVDPLPKSIIQNVPYSSESDDDGLIYVGWRGPLISEYEEFVAISILLDYLDVTTISPLQRDFVECEEPYCSGVSHSVIENSSSIFYLIFESVGNKYKDACLDKLMSLLKNIQSGKEELDANRLATIISKRIVRILSIAETSPHSIVASSVIGNFLYGNGNLKQRAQETKILDNLNKKEKSYWLGLLETYFVGPNARYACIIGQPSPSLMKDMIEAEKQRIAKQKDTLKDDLPSLAIDLRKALDENEKLAPQAMFDAVPVPSIDKIKFHPIERQVLDENLLPFRLQYDSIKTNFITMHVMMNTSFTLTREDRLYLPLVSELLMESAIMRDGKLIPHETVVSELFCDTVACDTSIGLMNGSYCSTGSVSMLFDCLMQVEISKYETAVKLMKSILYDTVFSADRIKTIATKIVSEIQQMKRSGSQVASATLNAEIYNSDSNQWATNFMRQQKFMKKILKELKISEESVITRLTQVRDKLTKPNNILVHIGLDKNKVDVSKLHEPWTKFIPDEIVPRQATKCFFNQKTIIACNDLIDMIRCPKSCIVGIGSIETNFMSQVVESNLYLKDPDVAPLFVLLSYLSQLEGPMWRQLRGPGLTYSYSIELSLFDGLLSFQLFKSTNLMPAYNKVIEIIEQHTAPDVVFEDTLFESAKASQIFEFIRKEKSAAGKSMQSLVAYLKDLDMNFNKTLINNVAKVTKEDLKAVGIKHLRRLFFDEKNIARSIVCNTEKVQPLIEGFKSQNVNLTAIKFDEEEFINSIEWAYSL